MLLLKNSWRHALINQVETQRIFFTRLYQLAPGFSEHVQPHAQRFVNSLTFMITRMENVDAFQNEMTKIAKRLAQDGAVADQFVVTGETVIRTLKHVNGHLWTKETEEAWFAVYALFCNAFAEVASDEN